jgi:predicted RNase H-like HicB family nuclease
MNLDIIVKPEKDGNFVVICPNFPNCESNGRTVEEALDAMVEKISEMVAGNIRANLKESFKDLYMKISSNGPINVPLMMTKLPISLN